MSLVKNYRKRPKLTQNELEQHLWAAANILRGGVDAEAYKQYIFGLLFIKRLNDVFEEEKEQFKEKSIIKLTENNTTKHQFHIPQKARWDEITKVTDNIGETLNKATAAIEKANPEIRIDNVLKIINFDDKARLPDETLLRLIKHFNTNRLGNKDLEDSDILGRAYEYLLKQFAETAGRKGGEFYTPPKVVELIVKLLKPQEGMRICDPTVGSGGMLIQCANYVNKHGGNSSNLSLYGQEKNLTTWSICKMNMILHGLMKAQIEKGDTIREPKLLEKGRLRLFDLVLANPPFSLKNWGREIAQADPYQRFIYGVPPKSYGDMAFIQHILMILKDTGRGGVILPHGVLFRGGTERRIRQKIIEFDLIEAVIGLPLNLFYASTIPGCILIFNKAKPSIRREKILFIDASREFQVSKAQNCLRDQDLEKIIDVFHNFRVIEHYCRIVPLKEIQENDYSLNISYYIPTAEKDKEIDISDVLSSLRRLEAEKEKIDTELSQYLKELGYERL